MIALPSIKSALGWAAFAVVAGVTAFARLEQARADRLAAELAPWRACEAAIVRGRPALAPDCPAPVQGLWVRAIRSGDCDAALGQTAAGETAWAARAVCTAEVKRVIAERDAAAAERINLRTELARVRAETDRAAARAAARVREQAGRSEHAAVERNQAVRDGLGRRDCGAECLRQRADGWVAPRP